MMTGKSFVTGFANELSGKATRDGQSYFNMENLASTIVFGAAGYALGAVVGKKKGVKQKLGGDRS